MNCCVEIKSLMRDWTIDFITSEGAHGTGQLHHMALIQQSPVGVPDITYTQVDSAMIPPTRHLEIPTMRSGLCRAPKRFVQY